MKERKEKKQVHICHICGKEINTDDEYEYIKTRRGTEIYIHKTCIGKNEVRK